MSGRIGTIGTDWSENHSGNLNINNNKVDLLMVPEKNHIDRLASTSKGDKKIESIPKY